MKFPTNAATGEYLDQAAAASFARLNGVVTTPGQPRNPQAQSGSRGFLLTWDLPPNFKDVVGFKIYKDTEGSLLDTIADPNARQYFVPSSSGSAPPVTNAFITAYNAKGAESNPVQAQGSAAVEAGAPPDPSPPSGSAASGSTGVSTGIGGGLSGSGNKLPRN